MTFRKYLAFLILLLLTTACSAVDTIRPDVKPTVYADPQRHEEAHSHSLSPAYLVYNPNVDHNRIGTPVASKTESGGELIVVSTQKPAIFYQEKEFSTQRGKYKNLIYRIHFPGTPYNIFPFILTSGNNNGLMVIITLNEQGQPVLLSQTGTCGCYLAIIPTNYTPTNALPDDWVKDRPLWIYGEELPSILELSSVKDPRIMLEVRPGTHRVVSIKVISDPPQGSDSSAFTWVPAPLVPESDLDKLPLGDGYTSLYYQEGMLAGHVKGSWKPWETLLMSWFSFDLMVGMDKDYDNPVNPFYTSLKPWARKSSNMADFPEFLKYWGWKL